jgi:hypothetical protein
MRSDYAEQLGGIESEFKNERLMILGKNGNEIKQLFDEHKKLEEHFLKKRDEDEEYFTK